jgi:hypothetical protein
MPHHFLVFSTAMGNCWGEDDRNATGENVPGSDNESAASALLGNGLSSRVELKIRCLNLPNMDALSLSDPFVSTTHVEIEFPTIFVMIFCNGRFNFVHFQLPLRLWFPWLTLMEAQGNLVELKSLRTI